MIKVSVFYANGPGARFDMDYYCRHHMPLVQRLCGAPLKGIAVEKGIDVQGTVASFLAMGHLLFESVEAFEKSFGPHTAEIVGDVPNYTNTKPVIQISEVMM